MPRPTFCPPILPISPSAMRYVRNVRINWSSFENERKRLNPLPFGYYFSQSLAMPISCTPFGTPSFWCHVSMYVSKPKIPHKGHLNTGPFRCVTTLCIYAFFIPNGNFRVLTETRKCHLARWVVGVRQLSSKTLTSHFDVFMSDD